MKARAVAAAAGGAAVLLVAIAIAFATARTQLRVELAEDEQAQGRADAPVTLLEFTDYQCPFCRRFQAESWPQIKRAYVDTGKVRFIVRDLPLNFHASAEPAAEAAHCAGEQGRFWPMHEALLLEGAALSAPALESQARKQGLDVGRFEACVSSGKYKAAIERNAALAHSLGLDGTPAFIVGTVQDRELHGQALMGALPFADFDAAFRQVLAGN